MGTTTKDLHNRFKEHVAGTAAEWTRAFRPLRLTKVAPLQNEDAKLQEDMHVKRLMSERGIDAVRGGSYVAPELSKQQVHILMAELAHHRNACVNCGQRDQYASHCPQTKMGTRVNRSAAPRSKRSRQRYQHAHNHPRNEPWAPVFYRCGR